MKILLKLFIILIRTFLFYVIRNISFLQFHGHEILIEINQPENNPYVIIKVTQDNVFKENTLERYVPLTLNDGITIKERGGSSNTRVIIKVGYSTKDWVEKFDHVKYNEKEGVYLFEFPDDEKNK